MYIWKLYNIDMFREKDILPRERVQIEKRNGLKVEWWERGHVCG